MKDLKAIDKEIKKVKESLAEVRGTKTEVYTRIVGYYRSLRNWNKGKREEYNQRLTFSNLERENQSGEVVPGEFASYFYFFRKNCPNCKPVKSYVETMPIDGEDIDVDTDEGFALAKKYNITATPTVVFFNNEGSSVYSTHDIREMDKLYV
jgi:glutaredoxin